MVEEKTFDSRVSGVEEGIKENKKRKIVMPDPI